MVPGTGCSVVGTILREQLGGEWLPAPNDFSGGQVAGKHKHNTVPELLDQGFMSPGECGEYLVFAAVRNPFSRWVTYYQRYAGDWIDEYFEFKIRQLEREREKFDFSEREYQKRVRQIQREKRKKQRRKYVIRALGFNTWMKITLLRWYMNGKNSSDTSPLESYAFPMLSGVDVVIRQEQLDEGLNGVLREAGIHENVSLPRKNATPGKKPYTEYYSYTTRRLAEYLLGETPARFGYEFEGMTGEEAMLWLSDERKPVQT
jgi:hypothetical protein